MRLLHMIQTGITEAYVWAYAYGRNGRILGEGGGGNPWFNSPTHHAYLIHRGTPTTPLNTEPWRINSRYFWMPWSGHALTPEERLTPACGRLRTQSRDPRFTMARNTPLHRCETCARLAPNTTNVTELVSRDPWAAMSREQRMTMPDPISGL